MLKEGYNRGLKDAHRILTNALNESSDDSTLEELRAKIYPQSGAHGSNFIVDLTAMHANGAVGVHGRGIITIVTGGAQPPPNQAQSIESPDKDSLESKSSFITYNPCT